MIPPVQSILEAGNIRTVGGRIYQTLSPQSTTVPIQDYIVWNIISNVANVNLSDLPDDDFQRVQIDVYSLDQTRARGNAQWVRDLIEAHADVIRGPECTYEQDTKLYNWSMDAFFYNERNSE